MHFGALSAPDRPQIEEGDQPVVSWKQIGRVGARQYGVITRPQLLAAGATPDQVKAWISDGRLRVLHRGVYGLAGVPPSPHGDTIAAVFGAGPGAAAAHGSAAWLWDLLPDPPLRPEVLVPSPRQARLHGVVVRRTKHLAPHWVRPRRGIPATDPLRTMLELGAAVPAVDVRDAVERGVTAGLFSIAALEWVRAELAAHGRNGCGVLRAALDERALGAAPADGMLEPRLAQLCARYRLPRPVFQYVVTDAAGRVIARVDFAYPELLVFLEVDGYEVHGRPEAMEADFDRQNRLVALGWVPIRFGWRVLVRQPRVVARQIEDVLSVRRGELLRRS